MNKTLKVFLEYSAAITTWLMLLWPTPGFWHNLVLEGQSMHMFLTHPLITYVKFALWAAAFLAILLQSGFVFAELGFFKGTEVALYAMMFSFALAGAWAHHWNGMHKEWEWTHIAETGVKRSDPPRIECRRVREVYYNHELWETKCEEF